LLAIAERNLQQGRLDSPKENNAVEGFRAVLTLNPDNQAALAGLDGVLGQYLVLANDALDEQQLEKAEMYLAKATRIAPANAEVLDIRTRIAKARVATQGREKIRRLLAEAENDLQNNRLTSPKGNNATERYRAVLDLDPGNQDARAGLDRVVSRYIVLVNSAMDGQKLDKAEAYLVKAARIAPTNAELVNVRARIEKARVTDKKRKDIELLLVSAEGDLQQGRLDSPTGSNAVEGYRSVLAIDPDNQAAREGLHRVVGRYLELANRSLVDGDLDRAAGYVVKAEGIGANNPALAELRAELEKARMAVSRLAFAVFPFHTFAICHYPVGGEVTDATEAVIRKQPRAKLQYSYYEEGADASAIPGMHELWSKNIVRRKPMLDIVRKVGRKLGVNGVLMAWYKCSRSQYMSEDTYEVEVYLIDVNRNQVFHAKEKFLDAKRAVSSVFGEFFAAYGVASG
jgi:tetratricopeptide (TPR) repeat protein